MAVVFVLSYNLGSIPSGTGRLDCQDVARGATNRSRGSEVQNLQPTGARAFHMPGSTHGSWQARRNRRDKRALERHEGLTKTESSLLTQAQTSAIGLKDFIFWARVSRIPTFYCECGQGRKTVEHLAVWCR
ncbi:hypothetical protein N657DRAFT_300118 [Parathielavia appendiculata]|uniref:Reverse transcriptase n=1 Tax=Parathielavia appendiculata TaxID=2587402 RepID=A0AAN6U5L1_9PEZI|nr:hypothetical protein N657DRAFT_300118 [Parathielavia appendiculata]